MKILVAGGAGFIGSVLVPLLRECGYNVHVVDLLWFGNHLPEDVDVACRELFELTEGDLQGYEQVIFLAGLSNDPMAEFDPALNFTQNGALPSYLAYLSKRVGVKRFIYASSCSVYGFTHNEPSDEESAVTCGYPYGISKLQGERGVMQLRDGGFSTIAIRQGTVCGYSPRIRFDLIVNTMFKSAMQDGRIRVNNPSIWRPIIDVRDTAAAFIRAVQAGSEVGGVFNVAYDNFTVGQVSELVKDALDRLAGIKVEIEVNNVSDLRNYKVTCKKAADHLGFAPSYSIQDTVENLYHHLDEYGDYSNESFYNIQAFMKLREGQGGGLTSR